MAENEPKVNQQPDANDRFRVYLEQAHSLHGEEADDPEGDAGNRALMEMLAQRLGVSIEELDK